jgi:DNA-binding IclR family transcriptional regulator
MSSLQPSAEILHLVRSEYLEMPGLNLTRAQMQRLFGFDQPTCDRILNALVTGKFLRRTTRDEYILAGSDR